MVTVAGALAIWTFASLRQQDRTEALSRRWLGEQWDVARHCLLGTPLGRGEGADAIARRLEARLLETLAEASEAEAPPDPETLWPTRCVPRLADLRADPSVMDADPGDAVATLEVLAPRVIRVGPNGPGMLALGDAAARARELAGPIATLDEAMPSGGEYAPERYADAAPRVPPADVIRSLACATRAPARRPFFRAALGDAVLYDELETDARSMRLTGEPAGAAHTLSVASAEGTETRPLEARGTHPRFWDARTLLWLDGGRVVRAPLDGAAEAPVDLGVEARGLALCRAGETAHLLLATEEGPRWVRWTPGAAPGPPVSVRPAPPPAGVVLACSGEAVALAWPDEGRWVGARCADGGCAALPPLEAGGDLQLAVKGDALLAVARGRRTDLRLARRLEDDGWSAPTAVLRGDLGVEGDRFVLRACEDLRHGSTDGRNWDAAPER